MLCHSERPSIRLGWLWRRRRGAAAGGEYRDALGVRLAEEGLVGVDVGLGEVAGRCSG